MMTLIFIYIHWQMFNSQTMHSTETRKNVLSLVILIGFSNIHNYQQFIIKTYIYN